MIAMSQLGEKSFLKSLLPTLHVDPQFINGFGHDASIVDLGLDQHVAFKIDRAPFPLALRRGIGDFRTWGRLAVVANVSDLLAVGATPRAMMVSLVLPGEFDSTNARAIIYGCEEACAAHDIAFLGGDTKEGDTAQVVGAALGTVSKNAAFGRASAAPGDRLFLAGQVGGFTGALSLLDTYGVSETYSPEWCEILVTPEARIAEGRYLRESLMVASASDLSDGLVDALSIFCQKGVGVTINEMDLPIHKFAAQAARLDNGPQWRFALGVGDWSIAFVIRDNDAERFLAKKTGDLKLREIGRFNDSGLRLIRGASGSLFEIPELINEQFRSRLEDDGSYLRNLLLLR